MQPTPHEVSLLNALKTPLKGLTPKDPSHCESYIKLKVKGAHFCNFSIYKACFDMFWSLLAILKSNFAQLFIMSQKTNPVWDWFQEKPDDPSKAVCQVVKCKKPVVSRGKTGTARGKLSTGCLITHLQNQHPNVHQEYLNRQNINSLESQLIRMQSNFYHFRSPLGRRSRLREKSSHGWPPHWN